MNPYIEAHQRLLANDAASRLGLRNKTELIRRNLKRTTNLCVSRQRAGCKISGLTSATIRRYCGFYITLSLPVHC